MSYLESINEISDIKKMNMDELNALCKEIRAYIIDTVSKNGGHLASNLGTVELTLALHYVFHAPTDKIIFDVGHQSYTHKILTGRREDFKTIRKFGGISGFPKTTESSFDTFNTGHSSTSLSAALGLIQARDQKKENYFVVPVIGDGSISSGMAFEALNNIGDNHKKLMVILNDNEMSISRNVGAVSEQLAKIRVSKKYLRFKEKFKTVLHDFPIFGREIENMLSKTRNAFKRVLIKGIIFEQFGLKYLGPIDGHNIEDMVSILKEAKNSDMPVLLHVVTQKGKGLKEAELQPEIYHGFQPGKKTDSFSNRAGCGMEALAQKHGDVHVVTAAMTIGTGLKEFASKFPKQITDVGISEQHAVTYAAGMAMGGLKPFVFIYSTFLQRAYDQILHDVCLQNLPVTFCLDRAGLNPSDGETHHGIYDLSYLYHMPNIEIFAPATYRDLKDALEYAYKANGPIAIRYPAGEACETVMPQNSDIDQWQIIRDCAANTTIFAVGPRMLNLALEVSKQKKVNIVSAVRIKPLDGKTIEKYAGGNFITLEDNVLCGGFYDSVLRYLEAHSIKVEKLKGFGYGDTVIPHGSLEELLKLSGITAEEIAGYAN